jgi:hypothetical protein
VRLEPEATPEESEAVRQALVALGLIEDAEGEADTRAGTADRDP